MAFFAIHMKQERIDFLYHLNGTLHRTRCTSGDQRCMYCEKVNESQSWGSCLVFNWTHISLGHNVLFIWVPQLQGFIFLTLLLLSTDSATNIYHRINSLTPVMNLK